MPGVRYTAVPECPAPISEPLKQILWVKKIPAARVPHPADPAVGLAFLSDAAGCELLQQTTAQTSWPVLWCDDERPRTAWLEQLELAERLVSQSHVTLSHAAGAAGVALLPVAPVRAAAVRQQDRPHRVAVPRHRLPRLRRQPAGARARGLFARLHGHRHPRPRPEHRAISLQQQQQQQGGRRSGGGR